MRVRVWARDDGGVGDESVVDAMSRKLDDLSSAFRPKAFELLARLVERGIAVMVIDTLRTPAEHAANLANGSSKTTLSKHLPRNLRGLPNDLSGDWDKSDAMDLAPFSQYNLYGADKLEWRANDPAWKIIRDEAEKLDLRSGARWHNPFDPGHVELILTDHDRQLATLERQRP